MHERRKLYAVDGEDTDTVESAITSAGNSPETSEMLEPWHDFLIRIARWTEDRLKKVGLKEWLETWRFRQWKFAAEMYTKHSHKLSAKALAWNLYCTPADHKAEDVATPKNVGTQISKLSWMCASGRMCSNWTCYANRHMHG